MTSDKELSSDTFKHSKKGGPLQKERSEYTGSKPGKVCLNCVTPMKSGRVQITTKEGQIKERCPICGETGQIASFERLLKESDELTSVLEELELRYGQSDNQ